jgi:hypothetical protein
VRRPFPAGGVSALRAFAVDYSGKIGAPCLFVLVDRIRGGKSKLWTWNLGDPAVVPKVAIAGNAFTIPGKAGTLRGTFVAPAPAKIVAKINDGVDQPGHNCGQRDKTPPRKTPTLFAEGGDDFFLVATIQDLKTPAPELAVAGTGLDARVTVGGRVVSFDGTRVTIAYK